MRPCRPSATGRPLLAVAVALLWSCGDITAPNGLRLSMEAPASVNVARGFNSLNCPLDLVLKAEGDPSLVAALGAGSIEYATIFPPHDSQRVDVSAEGIVGIWRRTQVAGGEEVIGHPTFQWTAPFRMRFTVDFMVNGKSGEVAIDVDCTTPAPPLSGTWAATTFRGAPLPRAMTAEFTLNSDTLEFMPDLGFTSRYSSDFRGPRDGNGVEAYTFLDESMIRFLRVPSINGQHDARIEGDRILMEVVSPDTLVYERVGG